MDQPVRQALQGNYEILYRISVGGMGAIYKVADRRTGEPRVVKVLRPEHAQDETLRARFRNEAELAMRLDHPNLARVHDFSVDREGVAYIIMEFIDGVTLEELLGKSGPPSVELGVEIGCQALAALGYLHREGIVHRDIAADNLMLAHDDRQRVRVKLIDLGIAKGERPSGLTATGTFMGKVRYASPEAFSPEGGATRLDERSDLYSFGVLLYELLTGKSPVTGETFSEMVSSHLFRPPLPFAQSDPGGRLRPELRRVVLEALEKRRRDRFGSAEELIEALSPFRTGADACGGEVTEAIAVTAEVGPDVAPVPAASAGREPPDPEPEREAGGPASAAPSAEAQEIGSRLRNAHLLLRLGRLDEAQGELARLLELDPGHGQARELLTSIERALAGRQREAGEGAAAPSPAAAAARAHHGRRLSWIAGLAVALAAGLGIWYLAAVGRPSAPAPAETERGSGTTAPPPPTGSEKSGGGGTAPADGAARAGEGAGTAGAPQTSETAGVLETATASDPPVGEQPRDGDRATAGEPRPDDPAAASDTTGEPVSTVGGEPRSGDEATAGESEPEGAAASGTSAPPDGGRRPADATGSATGDDAGSPPEPSTSGAVAPSPETAAETDAEPLPDVPPELVRKPLPRYPPLAHELGIGATVVVEARVDRDGRVTEVRIGSGDPSRLGFDDAALRAARQAVFRPARKDGEPVPAWAEITFEFPPPG